MMLIELQWATKRMILQRWIDKFKLTNLDTTISQRVNDTTFPSYKKQLGQLNE